MVVTGARGFIGRNLIVALHRLPDVEVTGVDAQDQAEVLTTSLRDADVVYHLAGVNRTDDPSEFYSGNTGFTAELCNRMDESGVQPIVVFSSSIQADRDNPYGLSKRSAETVLAKWAHRVSGNVAVYRLPNVFGKWGRAEYNSVVATFCHHVAHGLPLRVDNPDAAIDLIHVDDVIAEFLAVLHSPPQGFERRIAGPVTRTTVGDLADHVRHLRVVQHSPDIPDLSGHFEKALYSTYLSYLEPDDLVFDLEVRRDGRGLLAELVRESHAGQVFVSRTSPGITRGNHYHDCKVERFMVVDGEGLVRMRRVGEEEIHGYRVTGDFPQSVIIPPGITHSIENVGSRDMITLFWTDEVFDPDRPDTYFEAVLPEEADP